MSPKEIFSPLSLGILNLPVYSIYNLNLTSSASILTYICRCGSGSVFGRRQKAPEYGSNTDPDPQHWLDLWCIRNSIFKGSRNTKF